MKTHLDIKHEGTLGDDRRQMTFDENSIAHLMSVLTDLYSDPALAVIREYSTNAFDSHRAAGHADPIEVTLPTTLEPSFVVADHGVGLSVDEILNQFSKYGWSSKRDTDDEVGMLGLGCKSALSLVQQFHLEAVKDGVKAVVLITRESNGAGAVQVIDTVSTDERNGVKVTIPINTWIPQFVEKAHNFYRFWDPGTVYVNGEEPTSIWAGADSDGKALDIAAWGVQSGNFLIDPDIVLTDALERSYLIMGNVPYPIDAARFEYQMPGAANNAHYAIRVPIGCINFTPSREALHYTKRTLDALDTAKSFITSTVHLRAQSFVDASPGFTEAYEIAGKWYSMIGHNLTLMYKGHSVPRHHLVLGGRSVSWGTGNNLDVPAQEVHSLPMGAMAGHENFVHITGWRARHMTKLLKKRLTKFCGSDPRVSKVNYNGNAVHRWTCYLHRDAAVLEPWITKQVFDISEVEAVALDEDEMAKTKVPLFVRICGWKKTDPDPDHIDFYVFASDQVDAHHIRGSEFGESKVVQVYKARLKAFQKKYPMAVHLKDGSLAALQELDATFVPIESFWLLRQTGRYNVHADEAVGALMAVANKLTSMLPEINDPELKATLRTLHKGQKAVTAKVNKRTHIANIYEMLRGPDDPPVPGIPKGADDMFKTLRGHVNRYPMLKIQNGYYPKTDQPQGRILVDYLNQTYMLHEGLHLSRAY